ncbi:hypothetical protein DTO164E3_9049 [Paecilomyces variotii]|nr:hypothetical protein DTO164E3_9049 [Paecilomyces variotii]KAJ9358232.1 hypothetical protein DTO280E4_5341 [Paecilomyces variotii]
MRCHLYIYGITRMYKSLAGHRTAKQAEISELAKRLNALLYVVMIRRMFDHEWFGQVIIHLPFATLKAPKGPVLIIAPSMTLAQNWEMQWNLHVDGSHPRTGMVLVKGWIGVFSRARMLFIRNSKAFLRLSSFSNARAVIVFRLFLLGLLMLGRLMDLPGSNNGYILALGNCWIQTVLVDGLKTPLKPYQAYAVYWMLVHEQTTVGPRGGFLCDDIRLCIIAANLSYLIRPENDQYSLTDKNIEVNGWHKNFDSSPYGQHFESIVPDSAKLHEVAKLINNVGKDALVMSKWLSRRYDEENVHPAFSSTPNDKRTKSYEPFSSKDKAFVNKPPKILYVSSNIISEGLTITGATCSILLELVPMNKQFEQLVKRIHRYGQDVETDVYQLLADTPVVDIMRRRRRTLLMTTRLTLLEGRYGIRYKLCGGHPPYLAPEHYYTNRLPNRERKRYCDTSHLEVRPNALCFMVQCRAGKLQFKVFVRDVQKTARVTCTRPTLSILHTLNLTFVIVPGNTHFFIAFTPKEGFSFQNVAGIVIPDYVSIKQGNIYIAVHGTSIFKFIARTSSDFLLSQRGVLQLKISRLRQDDHPRRTGLHKAGLHVLIVTLSNAAVDAFTSQLLSLAPDIDYIRVRQAQVEQVSTFSRKVEDEDNQLSVYNSATAIVNLLGIIKNLQNQKVQGDLRYSVFAHVDRHARQQFAAEERLVVPIGPEGQDESEDFPALDLVRIT